MCCRYPMYPLRCTRSWKSTLMTTTRWTQLRWNLCSFWTLSDTSVVSHGSSDSPWAMPCSWAWVAVGGRASLGLLHTCKPCMAATLIIIHTYLCHQLQLLLDGNYCVRIYEWDTYGSFTACIRRNISISGQDVGFASVMLVPRQFIWF